MKTKKKTMNFIIWKIALRNILKNKIFSAINIFGLMLGFAGFLVVSLFILYEFSWDKSNEFYDDLYRVQVHHTNAVHAKDGNDISPHTHVRTAALIEQFPEFEKVSIVIEDEGKYLSRDKEHLFYDKTGLIADHNFLDVFTCDFIEGEQEDALTEPYSILLSESMAEKLFQDEKALGQTILYEKKFNLKVSGVYVDKPKNSTVRPSYVIAFSTLKRVNGIDRNKSWASCMTYARLKPEANLDEAKHKIKNLYAQFDGRQYEELHLCPISKIHLGFNDRPDYYIVLLTFALIGFFILTMAAFNYINFTIATSSTRGKEVAIRKLSGAGKFTLISQLQIETVLLTFIAATFALLLVKIILPVYNSFVYADITLSLSTHFRFILLFYLTSFLIALLSGIYPARVIASSRVAKLIKQGMFSSSSSRFDVKKVLVTLQFTFSVFLVCLTLFLLSQINYMMTKDLGFERDNILYARISASEGDKNFEQLRARLVNNPEIVSASMSSSFPFVKLDGGMINWEGCQPEDKILYRPNRVSVDFIENMKLKILHGRNFSREFSADYESACIINEAAMRNFGWENPIGKRINNNKWTIVGVVEDYHLNDIHNHIESAVLLLSSGEMQGDLTFAFRYSEGNREEVEQLLRVEFNSVFPNDPYEFKGMESAITGEHSFKIYQTIKKSVLFFTVFIILLAVFALLGMVSYTTNRRTKEIGIRKINGSSVKNLFLLLNRDYFVLLGISLIISLPMAFLMYIAFPGQHKIAPPVWVPFFAAFIIFVIILLTTGYQTYKAATRNPVEALRYE